MYQMSRRSNYYKLTNGKHIKTTLGILELNEILSGTKYNFSTLRERAEGRGHKIEEVGNGQTDDIKSKAV